MTPQQPIGDQAVPLRALVTASATRRGTRAHNADAAATFTTADLTTAAVVVDGIGNSAALAACSRLLAEAAVRIGAQRGGLAGVLTAAALIADPGTEDDPPDGVAVLAVGGPGSETVVNWVGDCRAYGWHGRTLRRYTTDHTVGQQLVQNGVPLELAKEHDNWVRTTLSRAVVATVYEVVIPAGDLVLLTSDGVHDQLTHEELAALVHQHQHDPQVLADAVVAAVHEDEAGYRDDATILVIQGDGHAAAWQR